MQNLLFLRKETRIFTKKRIYNKATYGKFISFSLIIGKILAEISIGLFICALIIIYSINPSEARTLKALMVMGNRNQIHQPYSGLIVYVKGDKNFKRSMVPKIISKSGKSIYCNVNRLTRTQYNFLINSGIATFAHNIPDARIRAGNNPYIVQAVDTINTDTAIISDKHALSILKENQKSKFLNNFKVSFVIVN